MFSTTLIDEVMAQPFYSSEEEVSFDSQHRRDALSILHSGQGDTQHEVMERSNSCIIPGSEIDGKGRNSTRRRIQVACNRCRKRKIKCSGDVGDGQGCSNCRSSGNTNCQFLRVNSSMLQTKVSGWPYPMNNVIPPSQRPGMYGSSTTVTKFGVLPGNSPSLRVASCSRTSEYDMGAVDIQTPYPRQSFSIENAMNYENETSASYRAQSSTYILPSSPQGSMVDYCGLTWNHKGWSGLQSGRASSETIFAGHDAENSLTTHPSYSYTFSGPGAQSTEISPAMTSPNSLPSPGQSAERTLPSPSRRNPLQANAATLTATDAISGLSLAHEYKTNPHWAQKNDPHASIQPPSHESLSASAAIRTKFIPSSAQEVVFGFLPIASTTSTSSIVASNGTFTTLEGSVDSRGEFRGNTDRRLTRVLSRDNSQLLSLTDYGSETYGYSSSEKSHKNRSETGDPTGASILMNGMPYTRPDQTNTSHGISLSLIPTDPLSDFRVSSDMHRTSVSALSNPDGF